MTLIKREMTIGELMDLGIEAFARGDLRSAHTAFDAISKGIPEADEAHFWLARTLNLMGRPAEADAAFEKAVAAGLHQDYVDYYRGVKALREENYPEAERLADGILARDPDDGDARMMGVRALAFQGKWHEAARKYGRAQAEEIADEAFGKNIWLHPFATERMMSKMQTDMRKQVDEKPIQPNAALTVLLKKLPSDWVHSIARNLGLPKRRKVADAIAEVAATLASAEGLGKVVGQFDDEEKQALRFLLAQGGVTPRQAFARKFGDDKGDSFWPGEHPPESTLGRLRDRGLVFTGRAPSVVARGYALVVPAQLRPALAEALGMEPSPAKPKGRAGG